MFNVKKPFYITRGVKEEIHPVLIKEMIDSVMRLKKSVAVDYLQIFKFSQEGDKTWIEHIQEEPAHKKTLMFKGIPNKFEEKVYIIDNGSYITVLLADEY